MLLQIITKLSRNYIINVPVKPFPCHIWNIPFFCCWGDQVSPETEGVQINSAIWLPGTSERRLPRCLPLISTLIGGSSNVWASWRSFVAYESEMIVYFGKATFTRHLRTRRRMAAMRHCACFVKRHFLMTNPASFATNPCSPKWYVAPDDFLRPSACSPAPKRRFSDSVLSIRRSLSSKRSEILSDCCRLTSESLCNSTTYRVRRWWISLQCPSNVP